MTIEAELNKFRRPTVELAAKRAGYICSNPDCSAPTSGPASEANKAILLGEAAHIYGAQPSSARYVSAMSFVERRDITNAIWLCRNCHKMVDADAFGFPAEALFEWRRIHERNLAKSLGKAAAIRVQAIERQANMFSGVSYLAQQIVIDRPSGWEYKLTLEILRVRFTPVLKKWRNLRKGLYTSKSYIVGLDQVTIWQKARIQEMKRFLDALPDIADREFSEAWGPPGQPGSETQILEACTLFCDLADQMLQWEEAVRFATLPHDFDDFQEAFSGPAGRLLESLEIIPKELQDILESEQRSGNRDVTIKVDLAPSWADNCVRLFRTAMASAKGLDESDMDWGD